MKCRFDRQKQKKIFDWERQHQKYVDEWDLMGENNDDNEEPHRNSDFRCYQAWYQQATRCRLRKQWTCVDYANIDSTDDEGMTYDKATRLGTQVEVAPVLDRVVILTCLFLLSLLLSHFALPNFVNNLEFFCRATLSDAP